MCGGRSEEADEEGTQNRAKKRACCASVHVEGPLQLRDRPRTRRAYAAGGQSDENVIVLWRPYYFTLLVEARTAALLACMHASVLSKTGQRINTQGGGALADLR